MDWGNPSAGQYKLQCNHNLNSDSVSVTVWDDTALPARLSIVDVVQNDVNTITVYVPELPDNRFKGRIVVK
jgi:hypothetical protein